MSNLAVAIYHFDAYIRCLKRLSTPFFAAASTMIEPKVEQDTRQDLWGSAEVNINDINYLLITNR